MFFAANRFIIIFVGGYDYAPDNLSAERLEASNFLRDVIPSGIQHYLKFLEIVFPPADPDYVPSDSLVYNDWVQTMNYIKESNLRLETLRVHFFDFTFPQFVTAYRKSDLTWGGGMAIVSMYQRILEPVAHIHKSLRWCFIHAAWLGPGFL